MCDQNQSTPSWLARNNIMVACPFCGSSDTVVDALAYESHHWVSCRKCGAKGPVFEQNCPTPAHEYDKENKPYLVTDQLIIGCMTKWNERADLTVRSDAAAEKEDTAKTSNNNARDEIAALIANAIGCIEAGALKCAVDSLNQATRQLSPVA